MFVGQLVQTPYGQGVVIDIRESASAGIASSIVIEPTTWVMDRGQKPVFYMNPKDVTPKYPVGTTVKCPFGEGVIMDIRQRDGIYILHLKNWKLATDKSPVLYLNQASISEYRQDPVTAPKESKVQSCLKNCTNAREIAKAYFSKGDFANAKEHYVAALNYLRYVDENLTNDEKASIFSQHIPCHNNVALCCFKLQEYNECAMFANNSFMLIEALMGRMPNSEVWKALQEQGMDLNQLLDWRRKSLIFMGKARLLQGDYEEAKNALETAKKSTNQSDKLFAELTDLLAKAQAKLTEEKKRAKQTWSKAFKKNATEKVEEVSDASASPSPTKSSGTSSTSAGAGTNGAKKPAKKASKKGTDGEEDKNNFQLSSYLFSPLGFSALILGFSGAAAAFFFLRGRRFR